MSSLPLNFAPLQLNLEWELQEIGVNYLNRRALVILQLKVKVVFLMASFSEDLHGPKGKSQFYENQTASIY